MCCILRQEKEFIELNILNRLTRNTVEPLMPEVELFLILSHVACKLGVDDGLMEVGLNESLNSRNLNFGLSSGLRKKYLY